MLGLCGRVQTRSWTRRSAIAMAMAEKRQCRQRARRASLLVAHRLLHPHSASEAAMAQIRRAQDVRLRVAAAVPEHHHVRRSHGRLTEILELLVREHHTLPGVDWHSKQHSHSAMETLPCSRTNIPPHPRSRCTIAKTRLKSR